MYVRYVTISLKIGHFLFYGTPYTPDGFRAYEREAARYEI